MGDGNSIDDRRANADDIAWAVGIIQFAVCTLSRVQVDRSTWFWIFV